MNIFVDAFLGQSQGLAHRRRHVRRTSFHAVDKVFQPLDADNSSNQKEVLSLKNLDAGDFTWSTCKVLLGLVVGKLNTKLSMTPQWDNRFWEIRSGR